MKTSRENWLVQWMIALTLLLGACATSTGPAVTAPTAIASSQARPLDSQAQPLDPQSLVGEWIGTWNLINNRYEGRYYLTIDRVAGDRVYGRVETTPGPLGRVGAARNFAVSGVLQGNRLTYGRTTLEIDGSEINGHDSGFGPSIFSLRKSTRPLWRPFAAQAPSAGGPQANGVYAGLVCYGAHFNEPARCYRAQASLSDGKLSGQWPARDPGSTMLLVGEVSASGDAIIRMHVENTDRIRLGTAALSGTLRDGRLEAAGSFSSGPTVTLDWKKT